MRQDVSTLNLVFDLDNTLVVHPDSLGLNGKLTYYHPKSPLYDFFKERSAVLLVENVQYFVLPGAIELLRYLSSEPSVQVSFFSAGTQSRNEALVAQLMTLAMGKAWYQTNREQLIILSREDLSWNSSHHLGYLSIKYQLPTEYFIAFDTSYVNDQEMEYQQQKYGILKGDFRKDLRKAIRGYGLVESVILIDDRAENVYPGQERSFLKSIPVALSDFEAFLGSKGHRGNGSPYFFKEEACDKYFEPCFQKMNSIYYLAGLLADCIWRHRQGQESDELFKLRFKRHLFNMQFGAVSCEPKNINGCLPPIYEPCYLDPQSDQLYFDKGLELLKTQNSQLRFNWHEESPKRSESSSFLPAVI